MAEKMAERNTEALLTLSEVHVRTGISMPTLQRYKKLYQARIPSVGRGRKQRYPQSALAVFESLKTENLGRRGRPRKGGSAAKSAPKGAVKSLAKATTNSSPRATKTGRRPGRPALSKAPAVAASFPAPKFGRGRRRMDPSVASSEPKAVRGGRGYRAAKPKRSGLITLTEVAKKAGISYPTAVRYVREFIERLPHEGTGRTRRFYPTAIEAVRQLREESGRGGRKAVAAVRQVGRQVGHQIEGAVAAQIRELQRTQKQLEEKIRGVVKSLQKFLD